MVLQKFWYKSMKTFCEKGLFWFGKLAGQESAA